MERVVKFLLYQHAAQKVSKHIRRLVKNYRIQQPRQIQARGLPHLDDFGVMQRLRAQAGGPVGEHGAVGDFHAERAGLNRLG